MLIIWHPVEWQGQSPGTPGMSFLSLLLSADAFCPPHYFYLICESGFLKKFPEKTTNIHTFHWQELVAPLRTWTSAHLTASALCLGSLFLQLCERFSEPPGPMGAAQSGSTPYQEQGLLGFAPSNPGKASVWPLCPEIKVRTQRPPRLLFLGLLLPLSFGLFFPFRITLGGPSLRGR